MLDNLNFCGPGMKEQGRGFCQLSPARLGPWKARGMVGLVADSAHSFQGWYSQRDSNPCYRLERAAS